MWWFCLLLVSLVEVGCTYNEATRTRTTFRTGRLIDCLVCLFKCKDVARKRQFVYFQSIQCNRLKRPMPLLSKDRLLPVTTLKTPNSACR